MFNLNINFMKKQLVIFILLGIIAIPSSVKAQKLKVSLSAGLSKSILNSDVSNLVNTRYNTKTGVATRVNLEYNFFKNFIEEQDWDSYKRIMNTKRRIILQEHIHCIKTTLWIYR